MIGRFVREFKRELIRVVLHLSGLAASGFIIFNSYEGDGVWDALGVFPGIWLFLVILISLLRR